MTHRTAEGFAAVRTLGGSEFPPDERAPEQA
jgi:hypothetical protein